MTHVFSAPPVRELVSALTADSPLGPREDWPPELLWTWSMMQEAAVQIVLFWGPDYIALYNDTYAPTIGNRHPAAFGQPARFFWSELWDDLEPLLDRVRLHGEVVTARDRPFYMERHGCPETVTFDISFSAVRGRDGAVLGVLCIVNETTEARRYEGQLAESEARFRNMADSAPVMMWVVDETGHCVYLNTRWYDFTGMTPKEAEGFGWLMAIDPRDRPRADHAFRAALERREPFRLEYRLRRSDGVYRWAIDAAEPRFAPDGTFLGYIGSVLDIDERYETEQALALSQTQFAAIAHSVDQIIWTAGPDGRFEFFNDRWYDFTGIERGRTDHTSWKDVFHPDDLDRTLRRWDASRATGLPYETEFRLRHRSGTYRWVIGRASAMRDAAGQVERWYGTCTDIHDMKTQQLQRNALLELQDVFGTLDDPAQVVSAAAAMLGKVLEVDRVGYGLVTPDGKAMTVFNDRALPEDGADELHLFSTYGLSADDLKAGNVVVCADFATDPRTRPHADLLKGRGAMAGIMVPLREQGRLVAVLYLVSSTPRDWTPGEVQIVRDVAESTRQVVERRRAERELRMLAASLEEQVLERTEALRRSGELLRHSQKMEAMGQLTGGIAHDFNNNLAVVISGLNLIQRRLSRGRTDDLDMLLAGAMEGAQRAATLTHRLLVFSRQQPLAPEPLDANRMIAGMGDLLTRTLGEQVRVQMLPDPDLWTTCADTGQLENAILNLAVNARDAMPDGGTLTIATFNAEVDAAFAAAQGMQPGRYVAIAVTDTGSGMMPEVVRRAFEPFFTTKAVGKGTGLGLSQVFGFVRQTGGHVHIRSAPGQGTTLTIYLPRNAGEVAPHALHEPEEDMPQGHGESILLVEDDDRVRILTEDGLKELGYAVTAVDSGRRALDLLEGGLPVDLLFTDVIMPEMTGRKLADAATLLRPGLPVIFATGFTSNAVSQGGILDPGTHLLQKPYMLNQLARKVRSVLDGARR